ncbi:diphthine synthase [Candidatus Woesearchaeota archaeon]|nr:diphthine synthase [Candidatus Woesearchaeota archaeon]
MTLYLIGIGLGDEKDISVKGLEIVKSCNKIYLENYTSILDCNVEKLEKFYGRKIVLADRDMAENDSDKIISEAVKKDIAFLVVGNPLMATTHVSLIAEAEEKNVLVKVIHNTSIFDAVGIAGLQLYKYGQIASIPFFENFVGLETPYNILKDNQKMGLHTLFLLDLNPNEERFMTVNDAIEVLLKIEGRKKGKVFSEDSLCIGSARLGRDDFVVKSGKASELMKEDFGKPPHCLIVPGKMHFMEEEFLEKYSLGK